MRKVVKNGHNCHGYLIDDTEAILRGMHGAAITDCYETSDEILWVTNDEYESAVNFCPFCGYKAKKQCRMLKHEED